MFCQENGSPYEPRTYQDLFKRCIRQADIPDVPGGWRDLDSSGGRNGIVMIRQAIPRFTNQKRFVFHIYIFPPQTAQLAQAQAGEHIKDDPELQLRTLCSRPYQTADRRLIHEHPTGR